MTFVDSSSDSKENHHIDVASIKEVPEADLDAGAKFLRDHPEHADYTEEEAKKVLRKIDWMLMPLMTFATTLAAADKIIISNAAVYGMRESINLVGDDYSWIGSIFYFGYLLMEIPSNYALQRFPVGLVLGGSFVFWNTVLLCMAAGQNFGQMAAMRFMLGMGEAALSPSYATITQMFYKKSEQPFRTAIWMSGFSSVITGILSYAVGNAHSKVENWRLLFLVFGSITSLFTVLILLVIPGSPMTCRWLNERQRYIAVHRTLENRTGVRNKVFKKNQLIEGLTDWKTWVFGLMSFSNNISNGALVTFAGQIVSGLGYSRLRTVLLGMPTGLFMTASSWIIATPTFFYPKKYRTISAFAICLVPLTCCVLMMNLEGKISLLVAYYFFYFYWGPYVCMTSISFANTAGQTKKTVVNAVNFTCYCISNIVAPHFFIASQEPEYTTGYNAILGFTAVSLVCIATYGLGCFYENKRRDKKFGPAEDNVDAELDAMDLTDKEKERWFRYVW